MSKDSGTRVEYHAVIMMITLQGGVSGVTNLKRRWRRRFLSRSLSPLYRRRFRCRTTVEQNLGRFIQNSFKSHYHEMFDYRFFRQKRRNSPLCSNSEES
jgi:hypothetical protein